MAETITCPVCGAKNPGDMEFCQNCQSRLIPLTGPLRGEDQPIQPGAAPTKRGTGELEPALPRWLRDVRRQAAEPIKEELEDSRADEEPAPTSQAADLLAGLESQGREEADDTPEWVARIAGKSVTPERPAGRMSKYVELKDEDEGEAVESAEDLASQTSTAGKPEERDELGEWFRQVASSAQPGRGAGRDIPSEPRPAALKTEGEEVPSWLRGLEAQAEAEKSSASPAPELPLPSHAPPEVEKPLGTPGLPAWLKNLGAEAPSAEPRSTDEQFPTWLQTTRTSGQGSTPSEHAAEGPGVPDWISSLRGVGGEMSEPGQGKPAAPGAAPSPNASEAGAPAFTADALSSRDVDAIFASMQTPDWLAEATRATTAPSGDLPPAAQEQAPIAPAELPSWVQAMRPLETDIPAAPPPAPVDLRLEEGGPLAGLQGVLPGVPGAGAATSKPQPLSAKLEATEQQQIHAELLEKILGAEVTPLPMKATPLLGAQRGLRWALAAILLIILGGSVFSGSQFFPLPLAVPTESYQAVQTVESIPAGAPVLLVFDFEPATSGEMEASAASLIDHLLLLRHPQIALVSTSAMGAALAERFMSSTLADRNYQIGTQYVDLGFLPGGLAGVHEFAQAPAAAVPLGLDAEPVWTSPVLQGVKALSDFASIIVLTDSPEAGRVWIEQTAGMRGGSSMVIVSSAQAGPMLLPYVDSGQINGLMAGIYGAVGAEQANGGLPGYIRQYWDAYSTGLYLAAFLIIAGGLWSLWRGMQDRLSQEAR